MYETRQLIEIRKEYYLEVDGARGLTKMDEPTALQAALYLRGQGHEVRILHRREDGRFVLSYLDTESRI